MTAAEIKRSPAWPAGKVGETEDLEDKYCPPDSAYLILRPGRPAAYVSYPGAAEIKRLCIIDEKDAADILVHLMGRMTFRAIDPTG